MTVPLTSTIIMLGPRAADSNACTGTALPIDLSHRQCHPFQLWRLTQSCRTALEHRQCARTNRLPLAATKPASNIDHQRAIATIPIVPNLPRLRSIRLL